MVTQLGNVPINVFLVGGSARRLGNEAVNVYVSNLAELAPLITALPNLETITAPLQIGDIAGGNYSEFEADGTLEFVGDAVVWDDLRIPFTQSKRGALLKPDFDFTNVGLLFPQNDTAEIIYIIAQMPHKYKLETALHPHIHWQQMNGNDVVWKLDYKWFINGAAVTAGFTTVTATTSTDSVFTWSSGNLAQLTEFTAIAGTGINTVSSMLLMKVYRDDNVDGGAGGGDALGFEFDIHYQIDTGGSRSELVK